MGSPASPHAKERLATPACSRNDENSEEESGYEKESKVTSKCGASKRTQTVAQPREKDELSFA
jgi:hypothetical protein